LRHGYEGVHLSPSDTQKKKKNAAQAMSLGAERIQGAILRMAAKTSEAQADTLEAEFEDQHQIPYMMRPYAKEFILRTELKR
jgi:hypothetical protein